MEPTCWCTSVGHHHGGGGNCVNIWNLYVFPEFQIFVKIFCTNLQSPVWSHHVGVPQWDTNMGGGKLCEHLELTLAIWATDYLN